MQALDVPVDVLHQILELLTWDELIAMSLISRRYYESVDLIWKKKFLLVWTVHSPTASITIQHLCDDSFLKNNSAQVGS